MNANTISSLPDEVLLKIFSLLDPASISNSILVSKRWKQVIVDSTLTMQHFKLVFRAGRHFIGSPAKTYKENVKTIKSIRRKFVILSVEMVALKETDYVEVIDIHKHSLKSLEFLYSQINATQLLTISQILRNLQCLNLQNTSMRFDNKGKIVFKKLEHLTLSGVDWKLFENIETPKLKSIKINVIMSGDIGNFWNFLATQKSLEILTFDAYCLNIDSLFSCAPDFTENRSTLKKFRIAATCPNRISTEGEQSFIKFLENPGKNLEEIELITPATENIYKFVHMKLQFLKKITLDAQHLPVRQEFYEDFNLPKSIKEVVLLEKFYDNPTAMAFLGKLTNIEALTLEMSNEVTLMFLEKNLQQLKKLSLKKLPYSYHPLALKFRNLIHFHCDDVRSMENLIQFLRVNTLIETFSVKEMYLQNINEETVRAINKSISLRHLKLKGGLKAMKEYFDITKEIGWGINMRTMELTVKNMNENFTRPFFFALPRNRKDWQGKCAYLDEFKWDKES